MELRGCYTALVTPFDNGEVAWSTLENLVERQIEAGVDGVVPVGTTGESPTLTMEEHDRVVESVVETVNGRCKVIAGTGGNSTSEALELTEHAKRVGADATLQVTPYYNKPTQEGLYRHFSAVADVGLPVVLYNVPGRTGKEIEVGTVARLASHPNIVAVKEAGGKALRVSETLQECDITILSGDDAMTYPMMALGGKGVISVASNLIPAEMTELTHKALAGDWPGALVLHDKLFPLFRLLFIETNPIPIKAAMAMAGLVHEEYRLPLCNLAADNRKTLENYLRASGYLST